MYNLHYAVHISSFMSSYMNECLLIFIVYLFHRVLDIFFSFFLHSSSLQFFYFLFDPFFVIFIFMLISITAAHVTVVKHNFSVLCYKC